MNLDEIIENIKRINEDLKAFAEVYNQEKHLRCILDYRVILYLNEHVEDIFIREMLFRSYESFKKEK